MTPPMLAVTLMDFSYSKVYNIEETFVNVSYVLIVLNSSSVEIVEFTGPQLDKFYSQEVLSLDVSQFPDPLKKILSALKVAGAVAAPRIFKEAMACT